MHETERDSRKKKKKRSNNNNNNNNHINDCGASSVEDTNTQNSLQYLRWRPFCCLQRAITLHHQQLIGLPAASNSPRRLRLQSLRCPPWISCNSRPVSSTGLVRPPPLQPPRLNNWAPYQPHQATAQTVSNHQVIITVKRSSTTWRRPRYSSSPVWLRTWSQPEPLPA